jgi:hypothetical protein
VRWLALGSTVLTLAVVASGCGGSTNEPAATTATPAPASTSPSTATAAPASGPGALQAEANAAAAGDIPDNQVFLLFRNDRAGYEVKYPEGWAQQGSGNQTVFRDKNNIVRVVVQKGSLPAAGEVRADRSLKGARITSAPAASTIARAHALKVVYTTRSAPSPVTGKRVTLTVDRYYLARGGHLATVDLGTPVGVDNLDAYRLMVNSFRWR